MRAHVKVEKVTAPFRGSVVSFSCGVVGRRLRSWSKFSDLLAFSPEMKHSTDQRAHRPTSSPALRSNLQLYLTRNINNLIYPPPYPTGSAQTRRGGLSPPILLSVSAGNVSQAALNKNNFLHHWSHNTPFFCFFLFFPLPLSSSPHPPPWKSVFLTLLLPETMKHPLWGVQLLWRPAGGGGVKPWRSPAMK